MIKYFCDKCGNELSTYDYDHAARVTITDPDDENSFSAYKLCSNCEFAVRYLIKENKNYNENSK